MCCRLSLCPSVPLSVCLSVCLSWSSVEKKETPKKRRTGQVGNASDLLECDRVSGGNLSLTPRYVGSFKQNKQTQNSTNKQLTKNHTGEQTVPSYHSVVPQTIISSSRRARHSYCRAENKEAYPITSTLIPLEKRRLDNISDLDKCWPPFWSHFDYPWFVYVFIYFVAYILLSLRILQLCLDCCLLLLLLNLQLVLHHIHQC